MTRGSFFKSLLAIVVSPKLLVELSVSASSAAIPMSVSVLSNKNLISDLQLLTPHYYKQYVEKYGNEEFNKYWVEFEHLETTNNTNYFWFENGGKLIKE